MRIDTIEQAIRDLCLTKVQGEGYRLAYRIAAENLTAGLNLVADSCNPIQLTRDEWEKTGAQAGANCVNIEITCSDPEEHRRRVESRTSDIPGLRLPTWNEVINREYDPWIEPRIVIDTAGKSEAESVSELASKVEASFRKANASADRVLD